jgi:hypothetical protein
MLHETNLHFFEHVTFPFNDTAATHVMKVNIYTVCIQCNTMQHHKILRFNFEELRYCFFFFLLSNEI